MRNKSTASVTIASGAALSNAVNLGDKVLCALIVSATWTAAHFTFQVSDDQGATWYDLLDDKFAEVDITADGSAGGKRIALDPSTFADVDFIKVRSGTSATPVNQAGDRVITLVARKFYALD